MNRYELDEYYAAATIEAVKTLKVPFPGIKVVKVNRKKTHGITHPPIKFVVHDKGEYKGTYYILEDAVNAKSVLPPREKPQREFTIYRNDKKSLVEYSEYCMQLHNTHYLMCRIDGTLIKGETRKNIMVLDWLNSDHSSLLDDLDSDGVAWDAIHVKFVNFQDRAPLKTLTTVEKEALRAAVIARFNPSSKGEQP